MKHAKQKIIDGGNNSAFSTLPPKTQNTIFLYIDPCFSESDIILILT
jgi:hypothetical protein